MIYMGLTRDERLELEELRLFKLAHDGKAVNRAFSRLEQLMDSISYDPIMNVRSFKIIAECLVCLKEEIEGMPWKIR